MEKIGYSIIVPVFNGEETLKICLEAITSLRFSNFEIIVVDDGSTDKTSDIIDSFDKVIKVTLPQNRGRISSRVEGAKRASYNNLIFIDSRIIVKDRDLINIIKKIGYLPLMVGELSEDKYRSDFDTIFYLIRKKYYCPYFPQRDYNRELWIDRDNFKRAPKGFGLVAIEKDLFFKIQPSEMVADNKSVSDDTLLFHNLVFKYNIKILRHTDIRVDYIQRVKSNIKGWIYHRGKLWADFYLKGLNLFTLIYLLLHLTILIGSIIYPMSLLVFPLLGLIIVSIYLAENLKDFIILIKKLPILLFLFYLGTLKKIFNRLFV
ncbi:MAG: hypothetical protein CR982_03585 [Candidatus Cloacimonadota bacterium]|nr:MAG: hypothetical protein CR982_03585 [Candidatus Cloacimonadota bacterium]PIE78306.1 MAG: hypothetical protein CSA15_08420 [Candidatus Delongbacteria bacterium]